MGEDGLRPDLLTMILTAVVVAGIVLVGVVVALQSVLVICPPHEIVVIGGMSHKLADGSSAGYKVVAGGRAMRRPILEEVIRMDRRLILPMLEIENASCRSGIPVTVNAVAYVKITSNPCLQSRGKTRKDDSLATTGVTVR